MSQYTLPHPHYRADIDGLRAIAVLLVIGFHAFPEYVRGGFIGVDIFFVISGFLISSIIFNELTQRNFSFVTFYSRRIRRIFPALIIVLATSLVAGWWLFTANEYKALGKYAAGGAGFVANLFFLHDGGYFGGAATSKPLLHLWSLGVEEQFYIVWPIILWIAFKLRTSIKWLLLTIACGSFIWGILPLVADTMAWESLFQFPVLRLLMRTDTLATFYLPQSRFWELLIGAALAHAYPCANASRSVKNTLALTGAALIMIGLVAITEEKLFPGYLALLPTLGAALIITASPQSIFNHTVLASRPLVTIGLMSYPLYLWHWPLLSFAHMIVGNTPTQTTRAGCVVAALILAWLTYHCIEKPVRSTRHWKQKTSVLLLIMAAIGMVGIMAYKQSGFAFRDFAKRTEAISNASGDWKFPGDLIKTNVAGVQIVDGAEIYTNIKKPPRIVFIGDSHVEQYARRITMLGNEKNIPVMFITGGGCAAIPDVVGEQHYHCTEMLENFKKVLEKTPSIDTIVVGGCWNGIFLGDEYFYLKNEQRHSLQTRAGKEMAFESLRKFLRELGQNHRVVFLLDNPSAVQFDPSMMLGNRLHFTSTADLPKTVSMPALQKQLAEEMEKLGRSSGAEIINPIRTLCPHEACMITDRNGLPIYQNINHLTSRFVMDEATYIDVIFHKSSGNQ